MNFLRQYNATATNTSLAITPSDATAVGDLMVAVIATRDQGAITAPSGWTLVGEVNEGLGGSQSRLAVYTRAGNGGGAFSTHTWTSTQSREWAGVIAVYTGGPDTTTPFSDTASLFAASAGLNLPTAAVTAESTGLLIAAWAYESSNVADITPPASMTERSDLSSNNELHLALADESGAEGVVTRDATPTHSASNTLTWLLVLQPANVAPNAPTLVSPVGGVSIDLALTQRLSWTFSDPDTGDTQSKFDLRYRPAAGGAWTDITGTTTNNFYDLPASTLTAGDYEWQVRTYDALGVVGPYSSSSFFTAAVVSNDITITAPTNGATISTETLTVTWSTPTQTHYQLRVVADLAGVPDTATVIYDTGEVASSSTRSRQVSYPDNGVTRHTQVRKKQDGLWSAWASVSNLVSYTTPAVPSIIVDDTSQAGAIRVQATHPTPVGDQPAVNSATWWRRRAKVDANGNFVEWYDTERDPGGEHGFPHRDGFQIAPSAIFTDWFVNGGGYSFRVQANGANGTSSYSEWSDDGSGEVVDEIDGGAPDTVYDDELDGGGP